MSILKYKNADEGNVSTATDLDGYFNGLATNSGAIDNSNTRTEWVSTEHIDWEDKPLTRAYLHRDNTANDGAYSGTGWTTISHGNNGSTEQTFSNIAVVPGSVLRMNFNCITNPSANNLDNALGADYFWIKIDYRYDSGSGNTWEYAGYYMRYAFDNMRSAVGFHTPQAGYRMISGTFIYIPGYSGNINGMRVQIKVEDGDCALNIDNWQHQLRVIGA